MRDVSSDATFRMDYGGLTRPRVTTDNPGDGGLVRGSGARRRTHWVGRSSGFGSIGRGVGLDRVLVHVPGGGLLQLRLTVVETDHAA